MNMDLELLQIIPTASVAILAIVYLVSLMRKNSNGYNMKNLAEKIANIEKNHLGTIEAKLDMLISQANENEKLLYKINETLVRIEGKVKKGR